METNSITSRIEKMQECHTWMLESEARHILVGAYAALTNAYGLRGDILQRELDGVVESICSSSRGKVMRVLQMSGGLSA
jgi:hypothetical protein